MATPPTSSFQSSQPIRRSSTSCLASSTSMRRSLTLPTLSGQPRRESLPRAVSRDSSSPNPTIETLYCHPAARIIAFTANAPDGPGSMSWSSKTERTIAVGPLRIYKTPNSVTFINCGIDFVRPIFPKSKCWCVEDANGKFVLEMRKPQYWRIEVPYETDDDIASMQELKHVFAKILLYEPFRRIWEPPVPIRYRPWTPKASPKPTEFPNVDLFSQAIAEEIEAERHDLKTVASTDNLSVISTDSRESDQLSELSAITDACTSSMSTFISKPSIPRSITAPPQLTLLSSPPSKKRGKSPLGQSVSSSSSGSSFHSINSWHGSAEPAEASRSSSPTHFDRILLPKREHQSLLTKPSSLPPYKEHNQETASDDEFQDFPTQVLEIHENHFDIPSITPLAPNFENAMLSPTTFQSSRPSPHRATTTNDALRQRRREFSPMPNPVNIFSPNTPRPRHLQTTKHLPTAILQKTCEILLSPPSHLVHLMLEWAARLAAGGWWGRENVGDGDAYFDGWGVGRWSQNRGNEWNEEKWEHDEGELDDYGMVIVNRLRYSKSNADFRSEQGGKESARGRSWEVD